MKVEQERSLDIVEKILSNKIAIYKEKRDLTALVLTKNMLTLLKEARKGNLDQLETILQEIVKRRESLK